MGRLGGAGICPDLGERLHAFRSLGGNCEFGFVQRYGGVEPSGLLRFAYAPIADLIHALDTDFSAYGAPDDLEIHISAGGAYYCGSRRYNIWSNTAYNVGSIDPAVLLDQQYGRVIHLKRQMLEDLGAGSKILVRKSDQGETPQEFDRLAKALARHGPSPLLLVSEQGEAWHPGAEVRRLGERVYAGSVRRFAPTEATWTVDLEPWLILCNRAYAVHHRLPEADIASVPPASVYPVRAGLRRYRGRPLASGLSAFTKAVDPSAFDPDKAYVFSAWVWIPPDCRASRIFAVTGQERLGWCDADPDVRGRWQRVWAAGRFRHDADPAPVGLGMFGNDADWFWSWGARLHEGVMPDGPSPPSLNPGSFRSRWFSRMKDRLREPGRQRRASRSQRN